MDTAIFNKLFQRVKNTHHPFPKANQPFRELKKISMLIFIKQKLGQSPEEIFKKISEKRLKKKRYRKLSERRDDECNPGTSQANHNKLRNGKFGRYLKLTARSKLL